MLIYTVLNSKSMKPKTVFTKGRSFKDFNQEAFDKDLKFVPFDVAYVFDDIDDICWAWEKLFTNVLDTHAPLKNTKSKASSGQSKFITPEIRKAIRNRNALKRKFNKSRTEENWEAYRIARNRVVAMRRESVKRHFEHLCETRSGKPREFWNFLRPLMHMKNRAPNDYITLKENNKIIRDQVQVADTLNEYFTNIARDLDVQGEKTFQNQSHVPNIPANSVSVRSFGFRPTNHHEIKCVLD